MITRPQSNGLRKLIHMDVFDLHAPRRDSTGQEEVVKLFVLVVEDVCIALDRGNIRGLVRLRQNAVERRKHGTRHDELVAVAPDDDVRVRIHGQDRVDEVLKREVQIEITQ